MTIAELHNRINILATYKNQLDNIFNYDTFHAACSSTGICNLESISSISSYSATNDIFNKIMAEQLTYYKYLHSVMMDLNQNNFILVSTSSKGDIGIKKIMLKRFSSKTENGTDYKIVHFVSTIIDSNFYEPSIFYDFNYIPTNPLLFPTSKVSEVIKGEYITYNPANIINQNESYLREIGNFSGIFVEQKDNQIGEFAYSTIYDGGFRDNVEYEVSDIYRYETPIMISSLKTNVTNSLGILTTIIKEFLQEVILVNEDSFEELDNVNTGYECYGISIAHIYSWIDETISAYTANIANINDINNRLPSVNFNIQNTIAEQLGFRESLKQVQYGGDMNLAELEMCVHFADGLESLSYDNKLSICNDLQISIEQLITKAELKTKLNNYAGFDNLFAYSTKTASYLASSADADAQISSVSVTVQVGYITKNVFGLPIGKFATIIQYGATFNTGYKERCSFDKFVGVIIMIVGMAFGNPYAIAVGMAITVVVKIIVKLLVDANVIGEKDAAWIEAALNVAAMLTTGFLTDWTYFAPTATSSLASTAGATATNTVAPTTAASVAPTTVAPTTMASVAPTAVNTASMSLWQGLNVGLQALSGIVKSVSVYEQSQSEQFVEQAKKDMEQMSQDLAQMQEKTIYFTNDKFYNLYDEAYKIPAIDYDKLYNF